MANTIASQTIQDGSRNLVVKVTIIGDGSGEETNKIIVDASTFTPAFTNCKLMRIDYGFAGFAASLKWDGATDAELITLPADHTETQKYCFIEGIPNNATTPTGDILMTTVGLDAGDTGHLVLYIKKKDA